MEQTQQFSNKKRVAYNTLFLYGRTAIALLLNLYTTRLTLQILGVSDFGLYSVLASIVAAFSFISMAMNASVSRYLCAELGRVDERGVAAVFAASNVLMLAVALAIAVLTEAAGCWYIANYLVVSPERLHAAFVVFHFSVASTVVLILDTPFRAMLVALENIRVFAWIALAGDILKFVFVLGLRFVPWDKLEAYAALLMLVQVLPTLGVIGYCRKHYAFCKGCRSLNWQLIRKMGAYAGWDTIGCLTIIAQHQGLNILINAFFGLIYNAAYGIANQVIGAVSQFVGNFTTASNPQIMKLYHAGNHQEMRRMVSLSSYLAAFLLMFFAVPLFIEVEFVLSVWLGDYPESAPVFIRIFLLQSVVTAMSRSIVVSVHAAGLVRRHNLTSCPIVLMILPVSYVLLKMEVPLPVVFLINIIPWVLECVVDSFIIRSAMEFSVRDFFVKTYLRILAYGALLLAVPYSITLLMPHDGFLRFLVVGTCSVSTFCAVSFFLVMNEEGREMTCRVIRNRMTTVMKRFSKQ
ncbi:MAG TPA: hypothetical protein DCZ56_02030 [Sutterella sp.]|nr:hypothetical protein [Sutterella sp.]